MLCGHTSVAHYLEGTHGQRGDGAGLSIGSRAVSQLLSCTEVAHTATVETCGGIASGRTGNARVTTVSVLIICSMN